MITKIKSIGEIILLASMLMLASCSPAGGELEIGENDNGTQIELSQGQVMAISLASNPSTGFGWHIAEVDENVIKQVGEVEFVQDPSDAQAVGVGGMETMRFEAVGSGTTTLMMTYDRAWEDVPPEDTFTITVVVP